MPCQCLSCLKHSTLFYSNSSSQSIWTPIATQNNIFPPKFYHKINNIHYFAHTTCKAVQPILMPLIFSIKFKGGGGGGGLVLLANTTLHIYPFLNDSLARWIAAKHISIRSLIWLCHRLAWHCKMTRIIQYISPFSEEDKGDKKADGNGGVTWTQPDVYW